MEATNPISAKPPLYKEILVALFVGGLFGPLVGWIAGMFATFFATVVADDTINSTRGMRTTAFVGGLIGIPLGAITGLVVSLPVRIFSVRLLPFLRNPWVAAGVGAAIGWLCALVILAFWNSSAGTTVYVGLHSIAVGGIVASVSVLAKPKWL